MEYTDSKILKQYDDIVNKTLINIYSLSKSSNRIILVNFNPSDANHKCIFEIAKIASSLWRFNIEVDLKGIKLLLFKIKNPKTVKKYRDYCTETIDIPKLISFMSSELSFAEDVFSDIYSEYYTYKPRKEEEDEV